MRIVENILLELAYRLLAIMTTLAVGCLAINCVLTKNAEYTVRCVIALIICVIGLVMTGYLLKENKRSREG